MLAISIPITYIIHAHAHSKDSAAGNCWVHADRGSWSGRLSRLLSCREKKNGQKVVCVRVVCSSTVCTIRMYFRSLEWECDVCGVPNRDLLSSGV